MIMSSIQIEENIARVSDILEQINKLNEMVDFHKNESKELSMMRQYEDMRNEFIKELGLILNQFKINVKIDDIAA